MNINIAPISKFARKVKNKISSAVETRKQVQKNWRNRSDNSNYYGSAKDFK